MAQELEIYEDPSGTIKVTTPRVEPVPGHFAIVLASLGNKLATKEDADTAGQLLNEITTYEKQVQGAFDEHTRAADRLHKFLTNLRSMALARVRDGKDRVKALLLDYQTEQKRLVMEDARRVAAEQEALRRQERERLEQEALERALAEDTVSEEDLAAVESAGSALPPVTPAAQTIVIPKVAGVSTRTNWKYRVTDPIALARAVVAGTVPAICLQPNDKFLAAQAKLVKGTSPWPGVEFYSEDSIANSGRG